MKNYLHWIHYVCLAAGPKGALAPGKRRGRALRLGWIAGLLALLFVPDMVNAQSWGPPTIVGYGQAFNYSGNGYYGYDFDPVDYYIGPDGSTIEVDTNYSVYLNGSYLTVYDPASQSFAGSSLVGASGDGKTLLGVAPGLVFYTDYSANIYLNGTYSPSYTYEVAQNGTTFWVSKYVGLPTGLVFQADLSPVYSYTAQTQDVIFDEATYGSWPTSNVFPAPPQTVYVDGGSYNLNSMTNQASAGFYYEELVYVDPTASFPNVAIHRSLTLSGGTFQPWGDLEISSPLVTATFDPFTWQLSTLPPYVAVTFNAPSSGAPLYGPAHVALQGALLQFYYTTADGRDLYWMLYPGGDQNYNFTVLIGSDYTFAAVGTSGWFSGTYDPETDVFTTTNPDYQTSIFAEDAYGNPLGLPPGITMIFGDGTSGMPIETVDGQHWPDYSFRRTDGSWGMKYTSLVPGEDFLIPDANGYYDSQVYRVPTGELVINGITGWPVSNSFPSKIYVNGVANNLDWSTQSVANPGDTPSGGAWYTDPNGYASVDLTWGLGGSFITWSWSLNGQTGDFDGVSAFSGVPSGTFLSVNPPPTNPSYGPPSLAWNGTGLGFVGWESQMLGLDVYEGGGTRMTIDAAGNAKIIDIASGAVLFTGTYDSNTYAFDFGAENYGTVSSKDSLGNLLKTSTPVPESGLTLWLSASSGVTTAVVATQPTNFVMGWADQSGHNNSAGAVTGWDLPLLVPNAVNNRSVVTFNGNAVLAMPTLTTWNGGGEVFVVVASGAGPNSYSALWDFGSGDYSAYGNGAIYDSFGTTGQYYEGRPNQDLTQFHIYQSSGKAGFWESWIDGVPNFVSNTNTVGFATTPYLGINAVSPHGGGFVGAIAEILVYDHTLSDSERFHALTYLSERYAVVPKATAPTNVTVKAVNSTTGLLSWSAPVDGARTTYNVQRRENNGAWTLISTNSGAQSLVDSGLNPTSNYVYEVQTLTTRGPSSWVESGILNLSAAPAGLFPRAGMVEWLMADGSLQNPALYLPDYSGAGNDAWQSNYILRPPLVPNALNGKPAFSFNGATYTAQQFVLPPNLFTGATAAHAFVVLKTAARSGINSGVWNFGNPVYSTWYPGSNGTIGDSMGTNGGNGGYSFTPAQDISQFHVYEVCAQTGLWQNWINGVPQLRKTPNTLQFTTSPVLGSNGNAGGGFQGEIAEFVLFNRALSTAERQGMLTYLNQKYALVPAPTVPANVAAVQLNPAQNLVTWDWSANNNEVWYVIERKTGTGGTYTTLTTVQNAGSYIDTTVVAGQQYYYRVYASNLTGRSDASEDTGVATPMMEGGTMPLSGIALWLMADGAWESPVGYLADYSGNGNDAQQPTAIAQPTLLPNATNGKPALHFPGNAQATWNVQSLMLPDVLHAATATAAEAVIVLRASRDTGNASALWNFGTTNYAAYADANGNISDNFGTTTQMIEGIPSQDITQFHVYEVCSQPGLWQSWIDGIPFFQSTSNATPSFTANPVIGVNLANNGFAGDIAEIVVYNRPLSTVERKGILAYLTQKYALVPVPAIPTGLSAVALNASSAMVTWNEPVTNSSTYFSLWRKQGTSAPVLLTTLQGVRTFIDNSVSSGNSYSYQVQAYNSEGASALSPAAPLLWNMPTVSSLPTSGMKLWIMGDGVGATPVSYLPDYSGNDNDGWQTSFAQRPLLLQNVINGKPVLRFNGNIVIPFVGYGQFVNLPDFMNASTATAAEALVVLRANAKTVNQSGPWNFGNPGIASWYAYSNGNVYESFGSNSQYNEGSVPQDVTKFHVYDVSSQAGLWQSWIDGTPLFTSTANTFNFPAAPILGINAAGMGFTGDIAELVVYNRALTTQERQAWQQYFAVKYFLSNFDPDGDGLTTGQELQLGLNPLNAYTYGGTNNDGAALSLGLLPLYPTALYPNPNGPPPPNPPAAAPGTMTILLTAPAGAVLH